MRPDARCPARRSRGRPSLGRSRRPGREPRGGQGRPGAERGCGHTQIVTPGPRGRRQDYHPFFIPVGSGAGDSETGRAGAARAHGRRDGPDVTEPGAGLAARGSWTHKQLPAPSRALRRLVCQAPWCRPWGVLRIRGQRPRPPPVRQAGRGSAPVTSPARDFRADPHALPLLGDRTRRPGRTCLLRRAQVRPVESVR